MTVVLIVVRKLGTIRKTILKPPNPQEDRSHVNTSVQFEKITIVYFVILTKLAASQIYIYFWIL